MQQQLIDDLTSIYVIVKFLKIIMKYHKSNVGSEFFISA